MWGACIKLRDLGYGAGGTHFPGTVVLGSGHVVECRIEELGALPNPVKG
jgi:hypothetical protein